ncbi:hypothetical protein PRUPE_6G343000 [Prunus persica]|uniref:Uncharacterized protein n=1 Tax=Prunus persica TaxID=3760 RepID=A0A251NZS9_PRUPE|nr:hypothetical protein PRUPE_6G343000 [Prunus persica]ONI04844.1 hypothetical protein PRUPE_6G343000 [Prunus persica]
MEIKFGGVNFTVLKFIWPHCQIYTEDRLAVIILGSASGFYTHLLEEKSTLSLSLSVFCYIS